MIQFDENMQKTVETQKATVSIRCWWNIGRQNRIWRRRTHLHEHDEDNSPPLSVAKCAKESFLKRRQSIKWIYEPSKTATHLPQRGGFVDRTLAGYKLFHSHLCRRIELAVTWDCLKEEIIRTGKHQALRIRKMRWQKLGCIWRRIANYYCYKWRNYQTDSCNNTFPTVHY